MKNSLDMKPFEIRSVELDITPERVFQFIASPQNLLLCNYAFKEASNNSALLITLDGELHIGLTTVKSESNTIDWHMRMPDGSVGKAYSRLTELSGDKALISLLDYGRKSNVNQ